MYKHMLNNSRVHSNRISVIRLSDHHLVIYTFMDLFIYDIRAYRKDFTEVFKNLVSYKSENNFVESSK